MADIRVRVAYERRTLVERLSGKAGPFDTMADVLIFASAVGAFENVFTPIERPASDPIRMEVFEKRNYRAAIDLLAVRHTSNPDILGDSAEQTRKRIKVFEGYATGGLSVLDRELKGVLDSDLLVVLLLLMGRAKDTSTDMGDDDGFDLARLMKR
ncbi:MAG: DNA phosphorothioation-associated protein 4 [Gemmatimonadota bacterium]|nr:DNA phosphorothioation-associated protein 4 [Gemmatimonadota bacterium]